jgi:hypothetical protein
MHFWYLYDPALLWHVYKSESSKFPPVVRRAYGNKELKPVKSLSPRRTSQVLLTLLILCGLQLPALATIRNVKTNCGATGNGSTNDTAAINTCIGDLANGDTLEFPAGTYLVTSLNPITVNNVTIDGSSNTATVISKSSGTPAGPFFRVGQEGLGVSNPTCSGWPGTGTGAALSATANEQSTTFTTASALSGVSAGSYVLLVQGGADGNGNSSPTGCDEASGCRSEMAKIKSVSGTTYTVDTMLHDTYNHSINGAIACAVTGVVSGITLQNITFDGGTTTAQTSGNEWGVMFNDCANCTISGVTFQNVLGAALLNSLDYGNTWSNITVTGAGSEGCGSAVTGYANANMTINTMSLSNLNPGTNRGPCLVDGAFGIEEDSWDNSTMNNVTVNSSGTAGGRPMKTEAGRWSTYNSVTVENGVGNFNGWSIDWYSAHNQIKNCNILNNSSGGGIGTGNAGINLWGNFVQYNTFSGCTVTGNGNVQITDSMWAGTSPPTSGLDLGNTFVGNTIGPGTEASSSYYAGLYIQADSDCVNNNVFSASSSTTGILVTGTGNVGSGNILNGNSSNLAAGTCGNGNGPPASPSGLTASVN